MRNGTDTGEKAVRNEQERNQKNLRKVKKHTVKRKNKENKE